MSKIILVVPGNATHSFLLGERWDKMYREELGLNAIGRSGVPVTVSHQGLDYELYPFLQDVLARYPSISVANAQYGHSLLEFTPGKHQKMEVAKVRGNVPVTFFSEFYAPEADFIPTEFFFHLKAQTFSYSFQFGVRDASDAEVLGQPLPADAISVNYQGRIGLVMDGFDKFNKAWFAFASDPSATKLETLMAEFTALTQNPKQYIVLPMDLEQPYVGSVLGEKLWTIFFNELKRRGLAEYIVPVMDMLEAARASAVPIKRPHRILTKWTVHAIQIAHLQRIARLDPRMGHQLYALASDSDLLSSWNRYVMSSNQAAAEITCRDLDGKESKLLQGHNKPLQEACLAACNVLEYQDERYADKLAKIASPNGLITRLHDWAVKNSL
ncbi:MAG: hypothetical protein WC551_00660 [Patescibacteria group bacterium]